MNLGQTTPDVRRLFSENSIFPDGLQVGKVLLATQSPVIHRSRDNRRAGFL
jgi:hypothetical protein